MNNHGGARPGAGRPVTGRTRRVYYLTDDEEQKVRKYVKSLRSVMSEERVAEHPTIQK